MDVKNQAYYRYLLSSEVSPPVAEAHRKMVAEYFWGIFQNYDCRKILDVGCGLGYFIEAAPSSLRAVGLDANPQVVEHCRQKGLAAVLGGADRLPFQEADGFDGIMCSHLLEHIHDPAVVFGEFSRVLPPGGLLIVRVPPFDASFYDDWTHVRPFTKKCLGRLAAAHGFRPLRIYFYHYDLPLMGHIGFLRRVINLVRHLPLIQTAVDIIIKAIGFPPRELILIAKKEELVTHGTKTS